jgi:ribosome biogenesis GTPase A
MLVVGMPNVGKSTLLNALRLHGVGKGKAAHTGAQPGVTRKIATGVKIIEGTESREGLYLLDTPGVFVTYVPDSETMLKLALCGSVKDTIIAPATLADYLLYHLNLHDPGLYAEYCEPTNDIMKLLEAVGVKTGRLQKGATPDVDASALWIIQRWRQGNLGRFALDEVSEEALERSANEEVGISINQAKKVQKNHRREMTKSRLSQNKIAWYPDSLRQLMWEYL